MIRSRIFASSPVPVLNDYSTENCEGNSKQQFPTIEKGFIVKATRVNLLCMQNIHVYTLKHINSCRLNNKLVIKLASLLIHQYVHVYTP